MTGHEYARPTPPFRVARDGTVTERAGGAVIGHVRLVSGRGWVAEHSIGREPNPLRPNTRKAAARALWDASPYADRAKAQTTPTEETR